MDVGEESDLRLVQRWREGNAAAGETFARRHFGTLWTYFRNKIDGDPDDLIQSTLLACTQHLRHLAGATTVRAYLLSIARSQLRTHYRRARPTENLDASCVADLASSMGTRVYRQAQRLAVHRSLRHVSLAHQEILELHYWNELPIAEIAEVLGVAEGTVKSRLRRARAALEGSLQEIVGAEFDASLRAARPPAA